jgi:hypothetical protein
MFYGEVGGLAIEAAAIEMWGSIGGAAFYIDWIDTPCVTHPRAIMPSWRHGDIVDLKRRLVTQFRRHEKKRTRRKRNLSQVTYTPGGKKEK